MPILYQADPAYNGDARISLGVHAESVRNRGLKGSEEIVAGAMRHIESVVNDLIRGLSSTVNGEFAQVIVTSPDTGEVIGWIGSAPEGGYEGGWFKNLYVGGNSPASAPFVADASGRVTLVLGDADDQAYLAVLDSGGNPVMWAGKNGTDYGLWADNLWVGGTGPATAPFFSDGSDVTIGKNGSVSLQNTRGTEKGFVGIEADAPKAVTGAANNGAGLIRLTVTTHGYETGDTVDVSSVGGVPNATGSWPITVITANTFDLIGSTFAGAYTSGGTVYRYYGGIWAETAAFGVTGFDDALFRVFADSSLRIGVAGGSRLEVTASGDLTMTDAELQLDGPSGSITIDPAGASIIVYGTTYEAELINGVMEFRLLGGGNPSLGLHNQGLVVKDSGGSQTIILDDNLGIDTSLSYKINGVTVIDSSANGTLASLTLTTDLDIADGGTGASTAADARTNLGLGSMALENTGASGSFTVPASLSVGTTALQYKDWAGVNQSLLVVTSVGIPSTMSITATDGVVTTLS